jgi:hypothetical protein
MEATAQMTTSESGLGISSGFSQIMNSNKAEISRIDQYKSKKITTNQRNIVFAAVFIGTLFFFMMFAAQIITGIFALFLTSAFGVASFFGIRFMRMADPLIKQKMKNAILKRMMDEARRNAVSQLDNQVIKNRERLTAARDARDRMGAAVQRLKSMINPANKGKPTYERKVEMLKKVEAAYKTICEMLKKGAEANKKFEEKVIEYKDMEKFADEVQSAMSLFKQTSGKQLEDMLSLEAFTHIEQEFNLALVTIENQTSDMQLDEED